MKENILETIRNLDRLADKPTIKPQIVSYDEKIAQTSEAMEMLNYYIKQAAAPFEEKEIVPVTFTSFIPTNYDKNIDENEQGKVVSRGYFEAHENGITFRMLMESWQPEDHPIVWGHQDSFVGKPRRCEVLSVENGIVYLKSSRQSELYSKSKDAKILMRILDEKCEEIKNTYGKCEKLKLNIVVVNVTSQQLAGRVCGLPVTAIVRVKNWKSAHTDDMRDCVKPGDIVEGELLSKSTYSKTVIAPNGQPHKKDYITYHFSCKDFNDDFWPRIPHSTLAHMKNVVLDEIKIKTIDHTVKRMLGITTQPGFFPVGTVVIGYFNDKYMSKANIDDLVKIKINYIKKEARTIVARDITLSKSTYDKKVAEGIIVEKEV